MKYSKDFRNFNKAIAYSKEMKAKGFRSCVQEFCDFDGRLYSVLVWEK